ncbi:MAG: hypothetical protein V9E98_03755 [Candidatus Nanopelagicales bacterium]
MVGVFDAGSSGFDSEIWGDAEQMMQAFRRQRLLDRGLPPGRRRRLRARAQAAIDADPRLTLEAKREVRFYAEQSEALATFIRILGTVAGGDLLDRRHRRRHDHDVRRGGLSASARSARCARWASGAARCWCAFLAEALLLSLVGGADRAGGGQR